MAGVGDRGSERTSIWKSTLPAGGARHNSPRECLQRCLQLVCLNRENALVKAFFEVYVEEELAIIVAFMLVERGRIGVERDFAFRLVEANHS